MKKIFALLAVVLAVVSCQKEINGLPVDSNNEAAVSLSVALPDDATRAAGADSALGGISNYDKNLYDIRFILEVYDAQGKLAKDRMVKAEGDATSATFNFRLIPGRNYKFVVWADFVANGANCDLHYDTSAGLRNVKVVNARWTAIDETRDAYTAAVDVVNYSGSTLIPNIVLTRPFAKLRVVTNDIKEMISVRPAIVKVNYFDTKFYTAFDAFAEEPIDQSYDGHQLVVNLVGDDDVDTYDGENPEESGEQTLFADYMFAKQGDRVKFTMDVVDNGDIELPRVTFNTDIPVNRNYLTTVYGPILTDANNITVTIDENFAGNINVNVWDGMTVAEPQKDAEGNYVIYEGSELAWIADQVNGVTRAGEAKTFIGETIKLMKDIDLGGNRWTPIGNSSNHSSTFRGTFDGNGKKITNLSVSGGTGVGLFGMVSPKAIKNLTIENAVIYGTHYAGALAGWVQAVDSQAHNRGAITNCHVKNAKVVLSVEDKDNGDKAAGLVGYAVRIDVNGCSVENAEVAAYRDVAGLLGVAHEGCVVSTNVVKDVTVTADQTVEYGEVADSNAGEVVGRIMKDAVVENNTVENVTVIRKVDSTEELAYAVADAKSGDTIYIGGEVTMPYFTGKTINFVGVEKESAVVKQSPATHIDEFYADAGLNFDNLTLVGTSYLNNTQGYQKASVETYNNCHFVNYIMFAGDLTTVTDCTFKNEGQYFWTGSADNITFTRCKFNGLERAVKVCTVGNAGARVATFNNCEFKATNPVKSALEIDGSKGSSYEVYINNCTAEGFAVGAYTGESLFEIEGENVVVTVDGYTWVSNGNFVDPNGDVAVNSIDALNNALINSAVTKITLLAGNYDYIVAKSNKTIVGTPEAVVGCVNLNGADNLTLKDINFDAAKAQYGYDGYGAKKVYAFSNIITGNDVNKPNKGAHNLVIDGCSFTGTFANPGAAISFTDQARGEGGSGNVTIKNCVFDNTNSNYIIYAHYTGDSLNGHGNFVIENNTFKSPCYAGPIYLGRYASNIPVVVKDNTFTVVTSESAAMAIQDHSSYGVSFNASGNTYAN